MFYEECISVYCYVTPAFILLSPLIKWDITVYCYVKSRSELSLHPSLLDRFQANLNARRNRYFLLMQNTEVITTAIWKIQLTATHSNSDKISYQSQCTNPNKTYPILNSCIPRESQIFEVKILHQICVRWHLYVSEFHNFLNYLQFLSDPFWVPIPNKCSQGCQLFNTL